MKGAQLTVIVFEIGGGLVALCVYSETVTLNETLPTASLIAIQNLCTTP